MKIVINLCFALVFSGFAHDTFAVTAALEPATNEGQSLISDRSSEQLKAKAEYDKKVRSYLSARTPWNCAEFNWKDGLEPHKPTSNIQDKVPPGESAPIGDKIPRSEYPKGMIMADAQGRCVASLPDAHFNFIIEDEEILKNFFYARETMWKTSGVVLNGLTGTRYFVRQRDYDEKDRPVDRYSYITIAFDENHEELFINLHVDRVRANRGDEGGLLKKLDENIHVKKVVSGSSAQLIFDSEWSLWAASPTSLSPLLWHFIKGMIKKNNVAWRNSFTQYLLAETLTPAVLIKIN